MGKFEADTENVKVSKVSNWNSGGTNEILQEERKNCSFDIEKMTNFLDGGKKQTIRRRWITGSTEDLESEAGTFKRFDLDRAGKRGAIAKNFKHFMDVHKKHLDRFMIPQDRDMLYMSMGQTMGGYPGFGLFLATVAGQSSAEQIGWWLPKVFTMQITGSYAQTELGHGSNVRGLETTAEFDMKTKDFVLNTPTLRSMKWWPSSMATATHAVVYAQLIIKGKEHGVHVFMVQMRDENLEPLPGIEVGDIGTKAGENEVDIGYLRMKNVRIPRKHMFEKQGHVELNGEYVSHSTGESDDKSHYLTMMTARVMMVATAASFLAKGATIAVRYNCVRQQGFKNLGKGVSYKGEEYKIIDYKMNQYVLLKFLSLAAAIRTTSNWLSEKLGAFDKDKSSISLTQISELHASAAGLKGYCCNATAKGLEELRKCCGGAGYLQASGIAPLVADYKWRATAEGDTTVMLLQTAKYLLKIANSKKINSESEVAKVLAPLVQGKEISAPTGITKVDDFLNLEILMKLFEYRTMAQVKALKQAVDRMLNVEKKTFDEAWSELTLKAAKTGQSHVLYFMLSKFKESVETCEDNDCKKAVYLQCVLFALADILDGQQWAGLLSLRQIELVEEAVVKVCAMIRPNAVGLVDAWDFHDKSLNSTIGRYDGNVYEAQYLAAVDSPLNDKSVPDYFDVYKQFLDFDFLKLRNKICDPDINPDDCDSYPVRSNDSRAKL